MRDNPLDATACDTYIPRILENNPGIDFRYNPCGECDIAISSAVGGCVTAPGEGTFTYRIGETVNLQATPGPNFVFSHWSGGLTSSQNPTVLAAHGDCSICACFLSTLTEIHVDDDAPRDPGPNDSAVSDPDEDGTMNHPFDSIQKAIELADEDGAIIMVRPGIYHETIDFLGKRITLTGIDPNDPNAAPFPVLDAAGMGPAVTFARGEDPNCSLTGFVITRGRGDPAGAIYCKASSPTIANCLIVGNRAIEPNGAAVCCTGSKAVLVNCTLADNYGGQQGSGLRVIDSNVVVVNSILWNNTPGEVFTNDPNALSIAYSSIDMPPLFARQGYWAGAEDPNVPVQPDDQHTLWIEGDYHLKSQAGRWNPLDQVWLQDDVTSPCIDAGDPNSPIVSEPAPHGAVINMGAFGGTTQASKCP